MCSLFQSLFIALLFTPLCISSSSTGATEAFYQRNIFYAGGEYVFTPSTNSTGLINQIYVEQLTPLGGKKRRYPVVFFHGGGASGTVSTSNFGIALPNDCSNG